MSGRRTWIALGLFLLAAFCVHVAHVTDMQIYSARPNLTVMALLVGCLFLDAGSGAVFGFLCGALEASYAGIFVGSILVSRSIVGFALGAMEERVFRDNVFVAMLLTLLGTFAVEALFYLFAPQPNFPGWAVRVAGESVYNAVLALPAYLILRRVVRGRRIGIAA
jgi:rod shape-determining protein MreD